MTQHTELIERLRAGDDKPEWEDAAVIAVMEKTMTEAADALEAQAREIEGLRKDAALVAARERERCAQLCEEDLSEAMEWSGSSCPGESFAAAIRALNTEGEG